MAALVTMNRRSLSTNVIFSQFNETEENQCLDQTQRCSALVSQSHSVDITQQL